MLIVNDIREVLTKDLEILEFEVSTLSKVFWETQFFEHASNFPHAHYGYLMTCMAKIDIWSSLWAGKQRKGHGISPLSGRKFQTQTERMLAFMETHLDLTTTEEHRVAVHLFRHTLKHTGALRYLYDKSTSDDDENRGYGNQGGAFPIYQ